MKLTNKKIGKVKYPEKTSVNLLVQERTATLDPKMQIGIFVIFIILLLVFVKFMVVDQLVDAYSAKGNYEQMQRDIADYQEKNSDYEAVREEYSHYGNGYLNDEEIIEVDRTAALGVIDQCVTSGTIQSVDLSLNVAAVTVSNVTLSTVSSIVSDLEDNSLVDFVTVTTAGTGDEGSAVTATITINYKAAGGDN